MVITRFNPTANGPLHLGHIYSLFVNEYFAHSVGGKFIVRFDDTSSTTRGLSQKTVDRIIEGQKETIDWFGIPVDDWYLQSDQRRCLFESPYAGVLSELDDETDPELPYFVRRGAAWFPYPYQHYQTAERVIFDGIIGVTHIIRGEEFSTEFSLYKSICKQFGLPSPKFIFLPRLEGLDGDISKTRGGHTVAEFRQAGQTPEQIRALLCRASLWSPSSGWEIWNLKPDPRIS